jgi:hypothetical protein
MYTNQSVFETVARHLFAQGKRAFLPMDGCLYRTPTGNSCAVGCLIPDDMYSEDMEGKSVGQLLGRQVGGLNGELHDFFEGVDWGLLQDLQQLHDNESNWENSAVLSERLFAVAKEYDLKVAFMDGFYFGMNK